VIAIGGSNRRGKKEGIPPRWEIFVGADVGSKDPGRISLFKVTPLSNSGESQRNLSCGRGRVLQRLAEHRRCLLVSLLRQIFLVGAKRPCGEVFSRKMLPSKLEVFPGGNPGVYLHVEHIRKKLIMRKGKKGLQENTIIIGGPLRQLQLGARHSGKQSHREEGRLLQKPMVSRNAEETHSI